MKKKNKSKLKVLQIYLFKSPHLLNFLEFVTKFHDLQFKVFSLSVLSKLYSSTQTIDIDLLNYKDI